MAKNQRGLTSGVEAQAAYGAVQGGHPEALSGGSPLESGKREPPTHVEGGEEGGEGIGYAASNPGVTSSERVRACFRCHTGLQRRASRPGGDGMFFLHRARLTDLAARSRLPTMFGNRRSVVSGGLMAYGASLPDLV